jgi:CRP-like cAMP-binding protein
MKRTGRALERRHSDVVPTVGEREQCKSAAFDSLATITRYRCHQEISSGEATDYLYRVVAGAAKRCATQSDGRRQIVNLLLPGDFFGFIAVGESDLTVEALVDGTQIARYPRRRVEALADEDPEVAALIREIAFRAISRLEAQLLIVGRVTALEKVAAFLLEMGERLPIAPKDGISLPISRCDIADFLAISVETVSRSLSGLKQCGLIRFTGTRQVSIVDREAIEERGCACRLSRL